MKRVLITGGTGFLGKHLARALKNCCEVTIAGRNNEANQAAERFSGCQAIPLDVARIDSVRDAFVQAKPDVVIHAAATKYVDLAERQPMECIDVNVLGSQNVARVALERNIETVIGISTDKASPPVHNTYGLSKALMEHLFCSSNRGLDSTKFACVRPGNIVWSTGSVFPLWKRMAEQDGLVRSTGPHMRRLFCTVEDAVDLVMTVLENIVTLHGTAVARELKAAQISDILDVWSRAYDCRWEQVANRPGERLDEFLVGESELSCTRTKRFNGIDHYVVSFDSPLDPTDDRLQHAPSSANAERLTEHEIYDIITNPPTDDR